MGGYKQPRIQRRDLCLGGLLAGSAVSILKAQSSPRDEEGYRPLFDGATLRGWTDRTRSKAHPSPDRWSVEGGVIVGGHDVSGGGSRLVSDEAFDDFEFVTDVRPDWPAAAAILVRTLPEASAGIRVLVNYYPHGELGGYYGKGIGGFHACAYAFSAVKGADGRIQKLLPEASPQAKSRVPLDFAAPVGTFLKIWKPGDWNRFRIRSVGAIPNLTTWINGEKISELDTSKIKLPNFDPKAMLDRIGRAGHIALEVQENGWAPRAACRWRNIYVRTL